MPDEEATRLQLTVLNGAQRSLHDALSRLNASLATMYHGALHVLGQAGNPERHPQCAHSLRELMEKLSKYVNVPAKAQGEKMGEKVKALHPVRDRAMKGACRQADGSWSGAIDGPLGKFLKQVDEFLDWELHHNPRKREETARVLRRVDASGRPLPRPLENLNVQAWMDIRQYFVDVCHHNIAVDDAQFAPWLDALERFLLERLVPRTYSDQDEIDALIQWDDGGA